MVWSKKPPHATVPLRNLFQTPKSGFGMDLVSLNIQRGRDHGLSPYNIWREQCGLKRFAAWQEMEVVMDRTTLTRLENIYEHVDDVDLFTGTRNPKKIESISRHN
jgi:peroxidase